MTVVPGLETFLGEVLPDKAGARIGLLCNHTAVTRELHHAADLLAARSDVELTRLFGPEHGVRGAAQDMVPVAGELDQATRVEVVSLYGKDEDSLRPPPGSMDDLDLLVVDIQDVGSRYYTFAATMAMAMEEAAKAGVEVVVCDRPNPIRGDLVEGPAMEPGFESFVGWLPVVTRHGLTMGELAMLHWISMSANGLDLELTVVPAKGWARDMAFRDTGLPWVAPSPNMPTPTTALVYPGGCLVEGTNLSEGRGTTQPFELVGAPWVDGPAFARRLNGLGLPGVGFRACWFTPMFHKHAGRPCQGVQVHVTDETRFRPVLTGVAILAEAMKFPGFGWRTEAYEFVSDRPAIDLLAGSDRLRAALEQGASPFDVSRTWHDAEERFMEERPTIYR